MLLFSEKWPGICENAAVTDGRVAGVYPDGAWIYPDKVRAVRARCGAESGERIAGAERAQKGAKDPRPVWIGAGAVAVQV